MDYFDNTYDQLSFLYQQEIHNKKQEKSCVYLRQHSNKNSILRQISIFERYKKYLPESGLMLDWGCMHAPDACMFKIEFNDKFLLHGCDFREENEFETFWDFAGLKFTKLDHIFKLPYNTENFDVVVGSGVLEHTAMDYESIKEIYRILKKDGLFVISFLPNWLSYSEFISRTIKRGFHRRLYKVAEIKHILKHYGFEPIFIGYHQFIPAQKLQSIFGNLWILNNICEKVWPLNIFSANIIVIAKKRQWM